MKPESSLSFDFCFIPNAPLAETVRLAQLGESLGYRSMWIPDQDFFYDPFVLATAVAQATERLGIGIGITSPLTRHPAHIARAAATLDEISGQRLRLGLGTGNTENVVRPMGLATTRSVTRVRDGVAAVARLLRGESVRFAEGVPEVALGVKVTRSIPIYVGARGPKMLELAGRSADGVLVESLFNAGGMDFASDAVRLGASAAGRSVADIDIVAWQTVVVTDDRAAEVGRHRAWAARMMQAGPAEAMLRIGVPPDTLERVVGLMNAGRHGEAEAAMSDEVTRCIVLIGTPDELVDRIALLRERGVCSVSLVSSASPDKTASVLTRFAKEVAFATAA
jgi:5,10-methylenetetrahydromethanopterin reductase